MSNYTSDLSIEELTANFTGFDAFACKDSRPFIYILMIIFFSITIGLQLLAFYKGSFASSLFRFFLSIVGNTVWAVVIDASYCFTLEPSTAYTRFTELNVILISSLLGAYGYFILLFATLIIALCNDPNEKRKRLLYDGHCCKEVPDDDGIVNINAFIKRSYTNPPMITIKGKIRSNFDYTAANDKEFFDFLPYKSWSSEAYHPQDENNKYCHIEISEDFELSPTLKNKLEEKLNYIRQISSQAYCEIIDMKVDYQISNINHDAYIFKDSKVVKFSTGWGLLLYYIVALLGFPSLLSNIYGLCAKHIIVHPKKTLSDEDDLPAKYLQFDQTIGLGDNCDVQTTNLPQLTIIENLPIELKQRYNENQEYLNASNSQQEQEQQVYNNNNNQEMIQDVVSPYEADPIIP